MTLDAIVELPATEWDTEVTRQTGRYLLTQEQTLDAIVELPAAEWDAEFTRQTGRYLLTQEQFDAVRAMRESVYAHPSAAQLLENGVAEQTIVWIDEDTGELCRCRPDWVHDNCILVDIKTTEDASPGAVMRNIAKWRYHVQAAFYSDGFAAARNLPEPMPFVFIFVEKAPPYAVGVYVLDRDAMDRGRELYRRDLERLAEAKASGCWDAYSTEIEMIELPNWAYQFPHLQNPDQTRREAEEQSIDEAKIAERERAANIAHRNQVHKSIAAELRQHVTSIQAAQYLVSRIANGEIANLKIIY